MGFTFNISAAEQLIRSKLIQNNNVRFYLSAEFSQKYVRQSLSLSYPKEVNLGVLPNSIIEIPLITHIIPVIWLSGKEYVIEEMDEDLYYSLIKIKEFFKRFFYSTPWPGELKPVRLVKNDWSTKTGQAASLFTGGLDSVATALCHEKENLTLITFNDAHQHAVDFAQKHHFKHSTIYMNYYDFLNLTYLDKASIDISKWFWDTTMGLAWVGAAAPFLYAKGIPTLYIPAGFTWQSFIFPDGQTLRQPACPLIDDNLSPMGLRVKHDLFTMTRTDKLKFISDFYANKNMPKLPLVVCNRHKKSDTTYLPCHSCVKCYLTMLDILAIGENLQDYGFAISESEFIDRFKEYIQKHSMRRGGTYVACYDTQNYLKQNLENLSLSRHPFYDWFMSIDLWSKVNEPSNRPLREQSFSWKDYQDLLAVAGL